MRCAVLARGLFELSDDSANIESKFKDEIDQLKSIRDSQSEKLSSLEKDLANAKKREETLESNHKSALAKLSDALKQSEDSKTELLSSVKDLKESLEKAQIDILSAGDVAFDRAKEKIWLMLKSVKRLWNQIISHP